MNEREDEKKDEKPVENDFLSFDERKGLRRMLSAVEEFPREFGSWIQDYMAVNGQFTRGQIQGLSQYTARVEAVGTSEATASGSYTDLATVGPQLTGLGNGTWIIFHGCTIAATSNSFTGTASIQINDVAAADSDGFSNGYTVSEGVAVEYLSVSGMRAVLKTLDNANNNTITAKYKTSGISVNFSNRWIVALKIA